MPFLGVFEKLFGGDNLGDVFAKIVGTFKLSPDKAAEMQNLVETHKFEISKLEMEMEAQAQQAITQEVEAAGANIRAEATNGDKFTSRARPTFLYVCNLTLFCNYLVIPLFGLHGGKPIDFPEPLFWLFGSVMLGYVGARSWEKISAAKAD